VSHVHWLESAAAYALDNLDPEERPNFESHLSSCAECRMAVHEFREVAGLLVHASVAEQAPAGLRARVTSLVRADAVRRPAVQRRGTLVVLPWLAAAASVLVALGAGEWARRASARVDTLAERASRLDEALSARDSVLVLLTGPEVHVVSLAAAGETPVARVFWNHVEQRFIVTAFDLPPAPPGRTYQLWAIARGKPPVSMGTFDTAADGVATAVLAVAPEIEALGFIDLCALTVEPAGGSPAPTETPRLAGEWRHTD
jgi:anti-sigma-K factor RskA